MGPGNEGENQDSERVTVKTYVPRYQKQDWQDRAEDLDMSQSEFVRTMVQAGKRGFDIPEEGGSGGASPGGNDLETEVLDVLESDGPLEWDGLVAELIGDFETQLEKTLEDLQRENRIQYSGRRGYTPTDE